MISQDVFIILSLEPPGDTVGTPIFVDGCAVFGRQAVPMRISRLICKFRQRR